MLEADDVLGTLARHLREIAERLADRARILVFSAILLFQNFAEVQGSHLSASLQLTVHHLPQALEQPARTALNDTGYTRQIDGLPHCSLDRTGLLGDGDKELVVGEDGLLAVLAILLNTTKV
jgi:hypothetical protein